MTLPRKKMIRSTQRSTVHSSFKSPGSRSYSERIARPNPTLVPQAPIPMGKRTSTVNRQPRACACNTLPPSTYTAYCWAIAGPSHPPLRPFWGGA